MTGITKSKFLIGAGRLVLLCVLVSPAARADGTGLGDVTITLPTISGHAGDSFVVFGTLANASSNTLDFGADSVSFNNTAISGFADVYINALLLAGPGSIGGNSILTGVDLFTVTIASDAPSGLYGVNFYDLIGGTDAGCSAIIPSCGVRLGTIEFTVDVQGNVSTPEPGTLALLISGLLAGLLILRRTAH